MRLHGFVINTAVMMEAGLNKLSGIRSYRSCSYRYTADSICALIPKMTTHEFRQKLNLRKGVTTHPQIALAVLFPLLPYWFSSTLKKSKSCLTRMTEPSFIAKLAKPSESSAV